MTNIKDIQFREYAGSAKYPFTEASTMRAVNGRQIPVSVFLDAILYPQAHTVAAVHVAAVAKAGDDVAVTLTDGVNEYTGRLDGHPGGCFIRAANGDMAGTLVLSELGEAYLKGVAKATDLHFNPAALVLRPDRVIPRPVAHPSVTVEGEQVVRKDVPLSFSLGSGRMRAIPGAPGGLPSVALDNRIGSSTPHPVIKWFNGEEVGNRPVLIRSAAHANLQIVDRDGKVFFHKRGDD